MIKVGELCTPWPHGNGVDVNPIGLEAFLATCDVDFDPPWQRGHVWTTEQRESFLGHLLGGGRVQPIILREPLPGNLRGRYEIIDGKQRLTSVLLWLHNEIAARLEDGRRVYRRETDCGFRVQQWLRIDFVTLPTTADVLRFYLRLNAGGTPHTTEELERVRNMLRYEER